MEIAEKTNSQIIVLIDEYDKPIINHVGKGEEGIKRATENRDILKEQNYNVPNLEKIEMRDFQFSTYDIDNLVPEAVIFQTGYLTIKDYDPDMQLYTLAYPNKEVRNAFWGHTYLIF